MMKSQEGKKITLDDFVKAYMEAYHHNFPKNSEEYKNLKKNIADKYSHDISFVGVNFQLILNQFKQKVPASMSSFFQKFQQENQSPYVLLLPYSQGTQYSNLLYDFILDSNYIPKDHIKIYGIGVATNALKGSDNQYLTASNDRVINAIRLVSKYIPLIPAPLEGNISLNCSILGNCHKLIAHYLADPIAKEKISSNIKKAFYLLYKNLILDAKRNNQINFALDEYVGQENADYQIVRNDAKVICADGDCDSNLVYKISSKFLKDEVDDNYKHIYGYLESGNYYILSKIIPPLGTNITKTLFGKITEYQDYFYIPMAGECKNTGMGGRGIPNWWHTSTSFEYHCEIPADAFYKGTLIISKFKI